MNQLRNKLFFGILTFVLITNLFVYLNVQYFNLRAIISFISLTTIPGLLIMLILKVRKIDFWEYLVYTIGSSIAFLMFGGLAVNWTLPWLHITDKPLSLIPLLTSFDIILLVLGIIAYVRNKNILFEFYIPKLDRLNKAFLVAPVIFPILSVLGAITLNNGGTNYLTLIMLGGISVIVYLIVLLRKKLNENVFPWAILTISISLLTMGWLRSWYVSGVDINLEYYVFQLVKSNQLWDISLFNNAYNACLSVNILPIIYSLFMKINDQYIFKLIIPLIFSITPVCVYLLLKRYTKHVFAFISTLFFMSQPTFMSWWWIPIRQEVALMLFSLALLMLLSKNIRSVTKRVLLLIFLFSMVVSHYSTTYIALALFIFTYIVCLIFRKTENLRFFSNIYQKLNLNDKKYIFINKDYYLNGLIIAFVLLFTFFWYSQLTGISDNFVDFTKRAVQNMGKIFSDDVRTEGSSFKSQWNLLYKPKNLTYLLQNYIEEETNKYSKNTNNNTYSVNTYRDYKPMVVSSDLLPVKINQNLTSRIYFFREIIKKLVKIFIIVGTFYLLFIQLKQRTIDAEYIIIVLVSLLGMVAILILPFASIEYDSMRQYQQLLIILSLPAVLGGTVIFNFLKREPFKIFAVSIVFLLYYLFLSEFIPQIIGGTYPSMQLNNFGDSYNEMYVHETEIKSSAWLFKNYSNRQMIYADKRALYKLLFSNNVGIYNIIENVFPSIVNKNAYVFSSNTNTLKNKSYINTKGEIITYNFPSEFLNQNKNLIYNNGESEIFK